MAPPPPTHDRQPDKGLRVKLINPGMEPRLIARSLCNRQKPFTARLRGQSPDSLTTNAHPGQAPAYMSRLPPYDINTPLARLPPPTFDDPLY